MTDRATLIASLVEAPSDEELDRLATTADVLEVRADRTGDLSADWLRSRFPGRILYTLRSAAEGGAAELSVADRNRRIGAAATDFDLVDLEAERDLGTDLSEVVPARKRILSWHGPLAHAPELRHRLERMSAVGARVYKLVPTVDDAAQAVWPLDLLAEVGRSDVIAFAAGEAGVWSRLVAPRLGAPWIYAAAGRRPAAPGQLPVETVCRDYGLPDLRPVSRLYGVVGRPVAHSLSPRLHNGLYRRLGIDALYLPFHAEEFGRFWLDLVEGDDLDQLAMPLAGLSVTAPFKAIALAVAGASSPLAGRIGAANTLVRRRGVWEAESTDPEGVVSPLVERGFDLDGIEAAVIGVGGAGMAAAVGLAEAGSRVCLANRTPERARQAAARLGATSVDLADFDPSRFQLVVHATPLGRAASDPLPFEPSRMATDGAIVDMVYAQGRASDLVEAGRARGLTVVDGREVLLYQALRQFRAMTGHEAPVSEARVLLGLDRPPSEEGR